MLTLQKAVLPEGLTSLGRAFEGAPELREVNLPSTLEFLGSAFLNCPKLEELTIPKSVTYIADYVVLNCYALKKLKVLHRVPVQVDNLNNQGFGVVVYTNAMLYVPTGSKAGYLADPVWGQFQHIEEEGGILGDVTGSGTVDVQDATIVVNYILGTEDNDKYDYSLAEMSDDEKINVFDVTAIINIILSNGGNSATARSLTRQNEPWESVWMMKDENELLFGIANPDRFTSFQFDMELPQGVDLLDVEWNGKTDHILQCAKNGENKYTVVVLSMASAPLPILNNALLRLRLSDTTGETVKVDNVLFVTPDGKAVRFNGAGIGMATGVQGIFYSQSELIYDISGRQLNMKREQLGKGIYIINNKKVVIK